MLMPISVVQASEDSISFSDVPEGSEYYAATSFLAQRGIIGGYDDGTFRPEDAVNRAEALKMVMEAVGSEADEGTETSFSDVSADDWFFGYVMAGVEAGVIQGYEDGSFRPEVQINVVESLAMMLRAMHIEITESEVGVYADVDEDDWYYDYSTYAAMKNITRPLPGGLLEAGRLMSRGAFADALYRLLYMKETSLNSFPLGLNWPTYVHPNGFYKVQYPFGWGSLEVGGHAIFFLGDEEHGQVSWLQPYAYGATVAIAVDEHPLTLDVADYVAQVGYSDKVITKHKQYSVTVQTETLGSVDHYFVLPNGVVVIAYTQVGNGPYNNYVQKEVSALVESLGVYEGEAPGGVSSRDEFLSEVRQQILVEGQGQAALDLFSDLVLIETDTIGIGTGPIDYYYSEQYNVTLKFERDSVTLLGLSEEKSTAF